MPGATASINQIYRSFHGLAFADDFEIQRRLATAVIDIDVAGNESAKVLDLTNLLLQLLVVLEKILGRHRSLAVTDLVESKSHYAARKNDDEQAQRDYDRSDDDDDFLCGHQLMMSGIEVNASKIVDERRIEEQAIETIKHTSVTGKQFSCIFGSSPSFESAFR